MYPKYLFWMANSLWQKIWYYCFKKPPFLLKWHLRKKLIKQGCNLDLFATLECQLVSGIPLDRSKYRLKWVLVTKNLYARCQQARIINCGINQNSLENFGIQFRFQMLKLEKEENFSGLKKKVRNFEVSTKCVDASLIFPSFSPKKLKFAWFNFPPKSKRFWKWNLTAVWF